MRIIHAIALTCGVSATSPGFIRKRSLHHDLEYTLTLMDRFEETRSRVAHNAGHVGGVRILSEFSQGELNKLRSLAEDGSGIYLATPSLTGDSETDENLKRFYERSLNVLRGAIGEYNAYHISRSSECTSNSAVHSFLSGPFALYPSEDPLLCQAFKLGSAEYLRQAEMCGIMESAARADILRAVFDAQAKGCP